MASVHFGPQGALNVTPNKAPHNAQLGGQYKVYFTPPPIYGVIVLNWNSSILNVTLLATGSSLNCLQNLISHPEFINRFEIQKIDTSYKMDAVELVNLI